MHQTLSPETKRMNSYNTPTVVSRPSAIQKSSLQTYNNVYPTHSLKLGIWLYIFLLIFEGALRKWFLPALATPLLIVRDPIALWLLLAAWRKNLLLPNAYMTVMASIGVFGLYTAILTGHDNLLIAIFGARIFLIHFPLIFVIGRVLTRNDVLNLGRVLLKLTIPMTMLIGIQFYSPQSAWVNRGVGGDIAGAGFDGALGFFRPPATFSFTTGTTSFYGFVAVYIFYFWLSAKNMHRLTLIIATLCLIAAVPLSMSRSLVSNLAISLVFVMIVVLRQPKYLGKFLLTTTVTIVALFILNQFNFFQTATNAFFTRFTTATEVEGGVGGTFFDRFIGGSLQQLESPVQLPFFGYGIGLGTNVGVMLSTGGKGFLISEGEWGRLIGEMGTLMGMTVILLRITLAFRMGLASYQRVAFGDFLPWLLLSFGALLLMQGQWAQPTALGFSTVIGGLVLASLQNNDYDKDIY